MTLPEGFRYESSFEEFIEAVDMFINELNEQKSFLLYGYIKDFYVDFSENMLEEEPEFVSIINNEVVPLLEDVLSDSFEPDSLYDFLNEQHQEGNIDSEDISEIFDLVEKKFYYIADKIVDDEVISRYLFKKNSLNPKFAKIRADINKYIIDDFSELKYALIEIVSNENVPSYKVPEEMSKLIEKEEKKVVFACDKEDIDHLIKQLELIKQRLE